MVPAIDYTVTKENEMDELLESLDVNLRASQKGNSAQDVLRIRRSAQLIYTILFDYKLNYDLFVVRY